MKPDIVTELQNLQFSSNQLWEIEVCKAMDEAADEIERLRGVIDTLRAEKALLEKRCETLEASRETWQKLAAAWEWLAENKTNEN